MSAPVTASADNVIAMPRRHAAAPIADGRLADADLDRWANRLARLLLGRGATAGARVALAVEPRIEALVAEAAARKIGAHPVQADAATARVGITTRSRRAELTDAVDWLILDDRSTLRHYLVSSDAPLSAVELRAAS
ncbi:AMP-binding protein [Nocardia sp. NPDC059177]|uniref:AMP-binding protein n=1 Tax=Nocardia sp. NPDC059177 TaxID=3346759 RepID=UPI0036D0A473